MEMRFNGNKIEMDDVRLIWRNFSGNPSQFNAAGNKNFHVVIPTEEIATALQQNGWNVKIRPPKDIDSDPLMHLPVKVKFNSYGPHIYLYAGNNKVEITEESCSILDNIEIAECDLDIRPYDWELPDGKNGRSAYLESMRIVQRLNRFDEASNMPPAAPSDDELPF